MTAPLRQSESSARFMPNLKRSAAPPSPQQRYSCDFVPITLPLAFLSHQAGENIRYSKFAPPRAVGFSLIAIGWLGYSLLASLTPGRSAILIFGYEYDG